MTALLSDTALVFGRYARQTLRSRFQILFGVLMPLLCLLFFGPLLTGLPLGGAGDSWQELVPGLLLQLALFGALFAGFSVIVEKQLGVVERMRVTPVSRLVLLLGRVLRSRRAGWLAGWLAGWTCCRTSCRSATWWTRSGPATWATTRVRPCCTGS